MSYLDTLKLNNSTFQIPDIDSIGERFRELYGSPLVASTVASMINTEKVYVYTGSETGYTSGHWYYWNGSAWTDGGVYNSSAINTDSTLSIAGMAADAKATGDEISDLKSDLGDLSELDTTDKSSIVNAINEVAGSSGGGSIATLSDVQLSNLSNGQALTYDSNASKWKNVTLGGGGSITIDSELSSSSENPVQNKVINTALGNKADANAVVTSFNGSTGAVTYTAPVTSVNGNTGAVTGLQTTSNLVTSVSASSTNTQYPSAKLLYDTVGNIETLLAAI